MLGLCRVYIKFMHGLCKVYVQFLKSKSNSKCEFGPRKVPRKVLAEGSAEPESQEYIDLAEGSRGRFSRKVPRKVIFGFKVKIEFLFCGRFRGRFRGSFFGS